MFENNFKNNNYITDNSLSFLSLEKDINDLSNCLADNSSEKQGLLTTISSLKLVNLTNDLSPLKTDFSQNINCNNCSIFYNSTLDPITGKALDLSLDYLEGLKEDSALNDRLELAFGSSFDRQVTEQLIADFAAENWSDLPAIKVISGDILNGANGAFASVNKTIYLSDRFIAANSESPEAIAGVVLEEIGHYIDSRINKSDAAGDEGDIFSQVVRGINLDAQTLEVLKTENDRATIFYEGEEISVEQASTVVSIANLDSLSAETIAGQTRNSSSLKISRTGSTDQALTVNYTVSGTATNGSDYNKLTGSIVIPVGATSAKLPINIIDDAVAEYTETVTITLSENTAYTLGTAKTGTVKISDNETPVVSITAFDTEGAENSTTETKNPASFRFTRAGSTANALTVNYTIGGSATNGNDYQKLTGSIVIPIGAMSAYLPIDVIDDAVFEGIETTVIALGANSNYILGTNKTAQVKIKDNEISPFITVNSPNGRESFKIGSNYGIAWNDNISGNVKVDLYKGGSFLKNIFATTASDGNETWTIGKDILAGSDYSIKIVSSGNNNIFGLGSNFNDYDRQGNLVAENVADNVVEGHVYVLVGYDSDTKTFKLFNPWGINGGWDENLNFKPGILNLTAQEILESFEEWTFTV
jgi:hypothetical protein